MPTNLLYWDFHFICWYHAIVILQNFYICDFAVSKANFSYSPSYQQLSRAVGCASLYMMAFNMQSVWKSTAVRVGCEKKTCCLDDSVLWLLNVSGLPRPPRPLGWQLWSLCMLRVTFYIIIVFLASYRKRSSAFNPARGLLPSDLDLKMTYTFKRGIKISTVVIYDPIQRCIYIWHKYNYINLNLIVGP